MPMEDEAGEMLEDVAQIHPAVDRLRQLVTSATILDLKATADGYWAGRGDESGGGVSGDDLAVQ